MDRGPSAGFRGSWRVDHQLWVEWFVLLNFGGLVADIFLAHSQNQFAHASEYVPLYFSAAATLILAAAVLRRDRNPRLWRYAGYLVGWAAIVVALTGLILHLDSRFFYERTIRSLTYAAPFAAPLAYAGLGLLLLVNRMIDARARSWPFWVLLLALGGFVGNFVFSLSDHAQNGFFNPIEWVPVVASAFAIGFLAAPFMVDVTRPYLRWCAGVLVLQAAVGLAGFLLHGASVARQPAASWLQKILSGAPPMAPLLFVNLSILAAISLWVLDRWADAARDQQHL